MKRTTVIFIVSFLMFNLIIIGPLPLNLTHPASALRYDMDTDLSDVDASFRGEFPWNYAGFWVSAAGDVNGDGFDDILIASDKNGGKTYLIFGKESGWEKDVNLSNADAGFISENPSDYALSVSGAGDVNSDGFDDILIGAPYNSDGGIRAGKVYLIFGKASGWLINMSLSDADASFIGESGEDHAGGYDGVACAGVGDVNGDGFDDILIGADLNNEGGVDAGQVYLIFGKASGWSQDVILSQADASFIGENANDVAGRYISRAGDINCDGYDDILIGSEWNDEGGDDAGKVYIIFGKASGWSKDTDLSEADASIIGENADDWIGESKAGAGDVNGDGYDDILIGGYTHNNGNGKIYLFFGKASGWEKKTSISSADASFLGEKAGDGAGWSIAGTGDVNGDGYDDFSISAFWNDEGGTDSGQTYLILGKESGWTKNTALHNTDASFSGVYGWENSGSISGHGGDFNGDGNDDIVIGANGNDDFGRNTGKVYVIFPEFNYFPKTIYSVKAYSDGNYEKELDFAEMEDTIYIELNGLDENPTNPDLTYVKVTTTGVSQEDIRLKLIETGKNTGKFHGILRITNATHSCIPFINALTGDTITIISVDDSSKNISIPVDRHIEIIPRSDKTEAVEDELYYMNYNAVGFRPVTSWTFESNASWLTWDNANHNLSGTPDNGDVGNYWVKLNITDGLGNYDEHVLTVTVQNTDPEIQTENVVEALEGLPYDVDYHSSDEGLGGAEWLIETNAPWLSLDSRTGRLSGKPTIENRGVYWVKVTIDDGNGGFDITNFTLIVKDTLGPISILTKDVTSILEDEFYSVSYEAINIDGPTTYQWYLETDLYSLTMEKDLGVLAGTPTNEDVGLHFVNITVFDAEENRGTRNFTLEVQNVNDKPFWSDIPEDIEIEEGELFQFDVDATDVDIDDVLVYEIASKPDLNITIDSETGFIRWRAAIEGLEGPFYILSVTVNATDGKSSIQTVFNISVTVNLRPTVYLLEPADNGFASHSNTVFQWDGYDYAGDSLTYDVYLNQKESLVLAMRENAKFLDDTELTQYTLDGLEVGATYYWTVIPHDGMNTGECLDGVFSFVVNTPPTIGPIETQKITVGETFLFEVEVSDVNKDDYKFFIYSLEKAPEGMLLDHTRGVITWIPEADQEGAHSVKITLTDGLDTVSATFEIDVLKIEKEPTSFLSKNRNLISLMVIIVIILMVFITMQILKKRRALLFPEKTDRVTIDGKVVPPGTYIGKPGSLSGPTITLDSLSSETKQPQLQAVSTSSKSTDIQTEPSKVSDPASSVPKPAIAKPALLPPGPFEPEIPAAIPIPEDAPAPKSKPTVAVESDVVPDFGIAGGPTPVQKDSVVHDIEVEEVKAEPDLSAALEDLRSAGTYKPTEEGTVVHEGDTGVWRPDVRNKVAENKEVLDQLKTLSELKASGALTEEEFERKKNELLKA
jgi:hypothetical protein